MRKEDIDSNGEDAFFYAFYPGGSSNFNCMVC